MPYQLQFTVEDSHNNHLIWASAATLIIFHNLISVLGVALVGLGYNEKVDSSTRSPTLTVFNYAESGRAVRVYCYMVFVGKMVYILWDK